MGGDFSVLFESLTIGIILSEIAHLDQKYHMKINIIAILLALSLSGAVFATESSDLCVLVITNRGHQLGFYFPVATCNKQPYSDVWNGSTPSLAEAIQSVKDFYKAKGVNYEQEIQIESVTLQASNGTFGSGKYKMRLFFLFTLIEGNKVRNGEMPNLIYLVVLPTGEIAEPIPYKPITVPLGSR